MLKMKIHSGQQPESISFCKTELHTKHIFSLLSGGHFTSAVASSSRVGRMMLLPGHSTSPTYWCNSEQNLIQHLKIVLEKLPRCDNYFAGPTDVQLASQ